jgi:nucleotide sugar dehydrogenase
MNVCVVGLGKIGLPLAAQFASKGMTVIGADVSPAVVQAIKDGRAPVDELGLPERLTEAHTRGRLCATTDITAAVRRCQVVVLVVPVVVEEPGRIDFGAMDSASRAVAAGLRPGTLVVYETTLPVGTTRRRYGPMLSQGSGLKVGLDFHLAFSPERVYSGRVFEDLRRYPKIVGGVDEASTARAADFYRQALDARIWPMENAEAAELVKLAGTTYRDINIAFANELARCADVLSLDTYEIIEAANSQAFAHILQPGVGVGGHCIPVYPYFLTSTMPEDSMTLPRAARKINDGMADYAVEKLHTALGNLVGAGVLILGLAYRGGVKEAAFSSAFLLARALEAGGAQVWLHDPLFTEDEIRQHGFRPASLEVPPRVDALVLQAGHDIYHSLDFSRFAGCRAILDGRHFLDPDRVRAAGLQYLAVGGG